MTRDEFEQELRDACLTARQIAYVLPAADEYAAALIEEQLEEMRLHFD
mgnify:CR=1 FL=1